MFLLLSWRCLITVTLFLCSGGKPTCRISLDHVVTHCIYSQARIMVFPVSMNGCIICSLSVLVLYPTLVVRSIGRHTLYLETRTSPNACAYNESEIKDQGSPCCPSTSGHSAGLNFFFSTQPQTARLSPKYGSLIYGSKPDSGKLIELALALDSCPWGPDQQTLFFSLPVGCSERSGAGYSHDSLYKKFKL